MSWGLQVGCVTSFTANTGVCAPPQKLRRQKHVHPKPVMTNTNDKKAKKGEPQWIVAHRLLSSFTIPCFRWVVRTAFTIPASMDTLQPSISPNVQQPWNATPYFPWAHKYGGQHRVFSADSDLEAFSRNPTGCNFAAISYQVAAFTKCLNEVFLSYWLRLLQQH